MNRLRRMSFSIFVAVFMISAAVAGFADDDDPPSRVARLKYVSGDVSVQPGGVDDWVLASVNRPLTTADRVWTDRDARAELHLGTAVMRMNSETSLALSNLTDQTVQVAVYQGTLNLRIKSLFKGEIYEVDTPNVAFTITKSGDYRFDVDANNDTTFVIVRKGEGVATGDGPAVKVKKEQYARFSGAKSMDHSIGRSPSPDGFDEWCRVRDSRETYYVSRRYVSPYTIGYEDLDGYGDWNVSVGYGPVWYPRSVAAGWAPYRYGHWVWINPWGWTWVDDAPWGFAPFHYGRWVYYGNRWGWCPGPINYRPYYAPALVAWVGGSHFSVGISFGGPRVGWFPLGYGEPYIPYRHVSRNYFRQVNISNTHITNVTNITNIYNNVYIDNSRNHNNNNNNNHGHHNDNVRIHNNNIRYANYRVRDAITNVDRDTMVRGKPVHRANVKFDPKDLKDDDVQFRSHVNPGRESVLGGRGDRVAPRPQRDEVRVKEKMAPPQRASVEERRRAIERDINRPADRDNRGRGNNGNDRNDRQAIDSNNRVPRPGRTNDVGQNGNGRGRSNDLDRGRPERVAPGQSDRVADTRTGGSDVSNDSDRRRDLPTSVPRPPRNRRDAGPSTRLDAKEQGAPRQDVNVGSVNGNNGRNAQENQVPRNRRDAGPTTRLEAKEQAVPRPNVSQGTGNSGSNGGDVRDRISDQGNGRREVERVQVPRPDVNQGGGNGNGGSNGRDAQQDRVTAPGNGNGPIDRVPRPQVERGPAMESPRNQDRGSSGRVEMSRPEPRVERAPQSRPEVSAPRSEPRMESPRSQPMPRAESPRVERQAPAVSAPRVERSAPPSSHGNGGGNGGGGQKGNGGGNGGGKDRGGNDHPDGKR